MADDKGIVALPLTQLLQCLVYLTSSPEEVAGLRLVCSRFRVVIDLDLLWLHVYRHAKWSSRVNGLCLAPPKPVFKPPDPSEAPHNNAGWKLWSEFASWSVGSGNVCWLEEVKVWVSIMRGDDKESIETPSKGLAQATLEAVSGDLRRPELHGFTSEVPLSAACMSTVGGTMGIKSICGPYSTMSLVKQRYSLRLLPLWDETRMTEYLHTALPADKKPDGFVAILDSSLSSGWSTNSSSILAALETSLKLYPSYIRHNLPLLVMLYNKGGRREEAITPKQFSALASGLLRGFRSWSIRGVSSEADTRSAIRWVVDEGCGVLPPTPPPRRRRGSSGVGPIAEAAAGDAFAFRSFSELHARFAPRPPA